MKLQSIFLFNTMAAVLFFGLVFFLVWVDPSKSLIHFIYYTLVIIIFVFSGFTSLDFYKYRKEELRERAEANVNRKEINKRLTSSENGIKHLTTDVKDLKDSNFKTLQLLNNIHEILLNDVLNKKELNEKLNITLDSLVFKNSIQEDAAFLDVFKKVIDQILITNEHFKGKKETVRFIDLEAIEKIKKQLKRIFSIDPLFESCITEILIDAEKILNDFNKKRQYKSEEVETKDLINHSFKTFYFRSYTYFSASLKKNKLNLIKQNINNTNTTTGDENTSLQNIEANNITINKYLK